MKLLVTGGSGFIGSHFIEYVLGKGADVVNLDKGTYAGVSVVTGATAVKGDICNRTDVRKAMEGCDGVVHFAAESHVDRSISDVSTFIQTNVNGTFIMLDEARKQDIKKFIMISTDEVYGQIENGSFSEKDVLNPRNPYAASKAGADRLAYSFFTTYGLPVVITRSSNNYGPRQYPEKLIPLFITNLLRGKKVPLYGDGKHVRDWLYVKDNAEAVHTCLEKGKVGEVYNIGGGNELSNLELTRLLLKALGKNEDSIKFVADRQGHDLRYSLNCDKVKALGWDPGTSLEEGLRKTVTWYKEHKSWWEGLLNL